MRPLPVRTPSQPLLSTEVTVSKAPVESTVTTEEVVLALERRFSPLVAVTRTVQPVSMALPTGSAASAICS